MAFLRGAAVPADEVVAQLLETADPEALGAASPRTEQPRSRGWRTTALTTCALAAAAGVLCWPASSAAAYAPTLAVRAAVAHGLSLFEGKEGSQDKIFEEGHPSEEPRSKVPGYTIEVPDGIASVNVTVPVEGPWWKPTKTYTFECVSYKPADANCWTKGVVLLHGFPQRKEIWLPLFHYWQNHSVDVCGVACDLRGYSPLATPEDPAEYAYDKMSVDIYGMANAMGYWNFHVVGDDHGAGLTWQFASDRDCPYSASYFSRLQGIVAIGAPHLAMLSELLSGQVPDPSLHLPSVGANYVQQLFSFYFAHLPVWNITENGKLLGLFNSIGAGIQRNEDLMHRLWWYHANMPKYIAQPPIFPASEFAKHASDPVFATTLQWYGGFSAFFPQPEFATPRPAVQAAVLQRKTKVDTVFICPTQDSFFLCSIWASNVSKFVHANYKLVNVPCGHGAVMSSTLCAANTTGWVDLLQAITDGVTK